MTSDGSRHLDQPLLSPSLLQPPSYTVSRLLIYTSVDSLTCPLLITALSALPRPLPYHRETSPVLKQTMSWRDQMAYPNDRFSLEELPKSVTVALDFWAEHTPGEIALKVPLAESSGFTSLTWSQLRLLRDRMIPWLLQSILVDPLNGCGSNLTARSAHKTIAFLVTASHEVIVPLLAFASIGYTCQFISPLHPPAIVAELLVKAGAWCFICSRMSEDWMQDICKELQHAPNLKESEVPHLINLDLRDFLVPETQRLHTNDPVSKSSADQQAAELGRQLLTRLLQSPQAFESLELSSATAKRPATHPSFQSIRVTSGGASMKRPLPEPFVVLHSFGSTSKPKLHPISLAGADQSGRDAAGVALSRSPAKRWRCQLITSVSLQGNPIPNIHGVVSQLLSLFQMPFHYSFQNPVWRSLLCGTTMAFPLIRKKSGSHRLTPDAQDILNSLWETDSDSLYCCPNALEAMLQLASAPAAPPRWLAAVRKIKEAHTGAAPLSRQKADLFAQYDLAAFQVFAATEVGLMFFGSQSATGDITWLSPVPNIRKYMLWYQPDKESDVYTLWIRGDHPALASQPDKLETYPDDPSILAWNTLDTFQRAPVARARDLWTFAGRQDDWIRCTNGGACRALEIEEFIINDLRSVFGFEYVTAVTIIGTGKPDLTCVVERKTIVAPFVHQRGRYEERERSVMEVCIQRVNEHLLQWPARLSIDRTIWTTSRNPIWLTTKGSVQRQRNEDRFVNQLSDGAAFQGEHR